MSSSPTVQTTQPLSASVVAFEDELNCIPNCAQGAATPYPVTITLNKPVDGTFTFITEQTADGRGTTETFSTPYLGQGACSTSSESTWVFA